MLQHHGKGKDNKSVKLRTKRGESGCKEGIVRLCVSEKSRAKEKNERQRISWRSEKKGHWVKPRVVSHSVFYRIGYHICWGYISIGINKRLASSTPLAGQLVAHLKPFSTSCILSFHTYLCGCTYVYLDTESNILDLLRRHNEIMWKLSPITFLFFNLIFSDLNHSFASLNCILSRLNSFFYELSRVWINVILSVCGH